MGSTLTRLCSFISVCVCVCVHVCLRVCVCVRLSLHAIVSPSLFVQWHQWDLERERTNKHTLPLSFPPSLSLSLSLSHTHTHTHTHTHSHLYIHTHTHTYSHTHKHTLGKPQECCVVLLERQRSPVHGLSMERWNVRTLERQQEVGVVKEGRVVRKPQALEWPPMGWLFMCVCVWEGERGWWHPNHSCRPLLSYLPVICFLSRQVLDQDNYSPIPVSTEQEFKHYTSQFPLQDPELEKV